MKRKWLLVLLCLLLCGGGIKGHIVDLFFNTLEECYAFGSRQCTIYFLS